MYRVNRGIEKAVNYLSLFSASRITVGRHRLLLKRKDQMGQILSYLELRSVQKLFISSQKFLCPYSCQKIVSKTLLKEGRENYIINPITNPIINFLR